MSMGTLHRFPCHPDVEPLSKLDISVGKVVRKVFCNGLGCDAKITERPTPENTPKRNQPLTLVNKES